ncbi:hypothetical protein ACKKBG_A16895 [Auxenochlorella protothecoides x Auxenochlorella symbiontica]
MTPERVSGTSDDPAAAPCAAATPESGLMDGEDWIAGEAGSDSSGDEAEGTVLSHPLTSHDTSSSDSSSGSEDGYAKVEQPRGGDVSVVYLRDDVAVWPSRTTRIDGRLSLLEQNGSIFIAWLPYTLDKLLSASAPGSGQQASAAKDRTMYAVHPVALSEVKALHRHAPPLGAHRIVLTLFNGVSLPPLYFQHGGIKSLMSALREHVPLARSALDANTYLVNDQADPLQRSLSELGMLDSPTPGPGPAAGAALGGHMPRAASEAWGALAEAEPEAGVLVHLTELLDRVQGLALSARDTASSLFGGLAVDEGPGPIPCAALPPLEPGAALESDGSGVLLATPTTPGCPTAVPGAVDGAADAFELLDKAVPGCGSVWGQVPGPPLSLEEFQAMHDAEGRLVDTAGFRRRVFSSGVSPAARPAAWAVLLGLTPPGTTAAAAAAARSARLARYVQLRAQWRGVSRAQAARWARWRERVARVDKDVRRTDRGAAPFAREGGAGARMLRRLLLTYAMYNYDLGYCQGMSDLAAPILAVAMAGRGGGRLARDQQAEVESEAFWGFANLMEGVGANFSTDCTGMHAQLEALRQLLELLDPPLHAHLHRRDCLSLYFCYRWLLILFKREFGFDQVLRLWEALWTAVPTPHLHLYLAVAALASRRRDILTADADFDGMLRLCLELAGKLDLEALLRDAEALCAFAGDAGRAVVQGLPGPPKQAPM